MEKLDGHLRELIERHIIENGVQRGRRRYHPSALTNRVPRHALRILDPSKIRIEDATWLGVKVAHGYERQVASELTEMGFRAYCPVGQKFVTWTNGRRRKERQVKIFARFAPYIFVGCPPGFVLQKRTVENILAILRNSEGPHEIPAQSIQTIKAIELSGEWDETIFRPEKSALQPGAAVRILTGALSMFPAILKALHENGKVDVSVRIFGRESDVQLDACQIGAT